MPRDIRETELYRQIEDHFRRALEPGLGEITGAAGLDVAPGGQVIAFTGSRLDKLEGVPALRVCTVEPEGGSVREITHGPNDDRYPRWSPDGRSLAFLSDRAQKDRFQLYLLDAGRIGEARAVAPHEGSVEYFSWSADGRSILLGVVQDKSEGESGTGDSEPEELPSWVPRVDSGPPGATRRSLSVYDVESDRSRAIALGDLNVWEAVWAGPGCVAGIVSESPSEEAWYSAALTSIDVESGGARILYRSNWQLGFPAATASGGRIAVIEALASDRLHMAGDLLLIDRASGRVTRPETLGVDVTYAAWIDEDRLLVAGIRGFESVLLEYNAVRDAAKELWAGREAAAVYSPLMVPKLGLLPDGGVALIRDSYDLAPEIVEVKDGEVRTIVSFSHSGTDYLKSLGGTLEERTWRAPDGLHIQGFLVRPDRPAPYPLVLSIHGGPIGAIRNAWASMLLARILSSFGYAVLLPNPRGSTGRGQEFARKVYGDLGGAEVHDHLAGIDGLVADGLADSVRLGVTGGSHGGFMTSWIVTQTDRFAAAVPVVPHTDHYSFLGTSNIGSYIERFLQDDPTNQGGRFFTRSPILFAGRTKTPCLNIAGGQDRCCPPTQATEFHHALLEHGVRSELVVYPEEGHGVRKLPAQIDFVTRVVDWFQRHMPASDGAVS